jgi:enoyl-CoA hydratase/carnithine racemase
MEPSQHSTEHVTLERRGPWGFVLLNRAKALHSLSLEMCRAMDAALAEWAEDEEIRAVLLCADGERAFCAGGDVRYLHDTAKEDPAKAAEFFRAEYRLNTRLQEYQKPVVAVMNGVTMGGGVGLSASASHRIATDNTVWAMPECAIGLIPDVGTSWHLNQLEGGLGLFLALTGTRLDGRACVGAGVADYVMSGAAANGLVGSLMTRDLSGDASTAITRAIQEAGGRKGGDVEGRGEIDRLFGEVPSLEALVDRLRGEEGDLAEASLDAIEKASPTSLKLTHRELTDAPDGFRDCITREFRIAFRLMEGPDFIEGVRAQVVDKDREPKWQPAALEEVTEAMLDRYFEAPEGGELDLSGA